MNSRKWLWLAAVVLIAAHSTFAQITAPTDLTIIRDGANIRLNWDPVAGASEYNVYKDIVSPPSTAFPLATVASNTYSDPIGVITDEKFFYVVTAVIPSGLLSGTIRDTASVGNGPLFEGVLVLAENQDDPEIFGYTYTLANGTYSLELPVGDYDVTLYKKLRPVYTTTVTITESSPLDDETINYQWPTFSWVTLPLSISSNMVLSNTNVYQMTGHVSVEQGFSLTVPKGTTIVGNYPTLATLEVEWGGDLFLNGEKFLPVVLTSNRTTPANGDWGGIAINGFSHNNRGADSLPGEGDTGPYGLNGTPNPAIEDDNSGSLRYFRVEYGGFPFTPTNELNSLALQAVGSGTTIQYGESIYGSDDGIEFFGGSVNVDHFVIFNTGDDGFDWTDGYNGHAHHVWVTQRDNSFSDRCIEADNYEFGHDNLPRANPKLANFTVVGKQGLPNTGPNLGDYAVTFRRGTQFQVFNFIVTLAHLGGIDLDDAATSTAAGAGGSRFDYSFFWDNGVDATSAICAGTTSGTVGDGHFYVEDAEWNVGGCAHAASFPTQITDIAAPDGWTQDMANFRGCGFAGTNTTNWGDHDADNPLLIGPTTYNARPAAGSPVLDASKAAPIGVITSYGLPYSGYVGAFNGPNDNWTEGWTLLP